MKVVFSDQQKHHNPPTFFAAGNFHPHPEIPDRADKLLEAASQSGLILEEPQDFELTYIKKIHTKRYINYLQNIYTRWSRKKGMSLEVFPDIHPDKRSCGYPKSAEGQAGFHHLDLSSPIEKNTWNSILWSAHSAAHAATLVKNGEEASYALTRPPGHHAGKDYAAGFCYFGNTAIAAEVLKSNFDRIAILDIDVHHGNGTQDIFYDRSDVLTVSIHADPIRFYPFFWGYSNEIGENEGTGFNINFPLPRGTEDGDYLKALELAINKINDFSPQGLVIALGLDAYKEDPLTGLSITTEGFQKIGKRIGKILLPTVIVQEGGYLCPDLGLNLSSFLEGFISGRGL
tara:strand:+ start:78 stop:1109 length:1032 start_codon:yes stop_codon:yes gene_type:complete